MNYARNSASFRSEQRNAIKSSKDEHRNIVGVVSGKLSARATLFTSGSFPENVNYAVK
jgi:hypothetical protein